jgi:plastocyanin
MRLICTILNCAVFLAAGSCPVRCRAQDSSVSLNVVVERAEKPKAKTAAGKAQDASNVAVWLTPLDRTDTNGQHYPPTDKPPQLVQWHKTFEPHVMIVPVGTRVEFPNKDPFFHNIFSLFDGRRFDLGLYEAGTTRSVLFDRAGVSFLFCNIHAEMSAVIVSVATPYFGLSDRSGNLIIRGVPNGRYQMNAWYERASPEYLKGLTRTVTISDSTRSLGPLRIEESPKFTPAHKNKYGLDYVPPPNADYDRP